MSDDYCGFCAEDVTECRCCDDEEHEDCIQRDRAKLGTSECPGYCVPICAWCEVAHECPTECTAAGFACPYDGLDNTPGRYA